MEKDAVYLNKMLQNEKMGLNLYNRYVNKFSNNSIKREVEDFIKGHERHTTRLKNMMATRKVDFNDSIGLKGNLTGAYTSMKLLVRKNTENLLDDMYKIESNSINVANQFLEEFSSSIRPDIEKLIEENKRSLQKITRLKENIKNEK